MANSSPGDRIPGGNPGSVAGNRGAPGAGGVGNPIAAATPATTPLNTPPSGTPALPVLSGNEQVKLTLSGQVNREVLVQSDGRGRASSYFADNNNSSTRIRALGAGRVDDTTTILSASEFDLRSNSSAQITRQSVNNNGGDTPILGPFRIRRAEAGVRSDLYGTALLGRGSTYTDGIAELDLSGTDVASYASQTDQGGNLQFSNRLSPFRRATDPRNNQVFDDFDGARDDRFRYDTPAWNGLSVGGSVAQGNYFDLGGRYSREIEGAKVVAGIGYQNYTNTIPGRNPQDGSSPALTPFAWRVSGSGAILFENGFNALISAGIGHHYAGCCGAGAPPPDAFTYYTKIGYQAALFDVGRTNFSVDFGQTMDRVQVGDTATRVGAEVNQQFLNKAVEVYGSYQHLTLRRIGSLLNPSDLFIVGSRVQF